MCDFDLWPLYLIGLVFQIPETTPTQYLTLTLKNLGFDTFKTNLLVIPSTVFHMITMLLLTYVAEIWGELTLTAAFGQVWALPFLVYIYVVDITKINKWQAFGIMSLLLSYPSGEHAPTHITYFLTIDSTSYSSSMELPQLKRRPFSNRLSSPVQYVRAGWRDRRVERLPC
jgi:drug/metabolite transporter superfamily protein YnfA